MTPRKTIEERLQEGNLTGKQLGLLLFDALGNFRAKPSLGYSEFSAVDAAAKEELDQLQAQTYFHYESLVYAIDRFIQTRGEVNYYGLRYAENLICRDLQDYHRREDTLKIFHPTPEQLSVIDKGILARRSDMYRENKQLLIYDPKTHTLNIDRFIFVVEKLYIPAFKEAIAFDILLNLFKSKYGISASTVKKLKRKNSDNYTMFEQMQSVIKIYGTDEMKEYFSSVKEELLRPSESSVYAVELIISNWKKAQGRYSVDSIITLVSQLLMPPLELKTRIKDEGGEDER